MLFKISCSLLYQMLHQIITIQMLFWMQPMDNTFFIKKLFLPWAVRVPTLINPPRHLVTFSSFTCMTGCKESGKEMKNVPFKKCLIKKVHLYRKLGCMSKPSIWYFSSCYYRFLARMDEAQNFIKYYLRSLDLQLL